MRYKITIHFRDLHDEAYGVDGYSTGHCTLQLYTFGDTATTKIFPLADIKEIEIVEII